MGISQEELAERADLHRTYISDVERGARNLSLESIDKLARALEISMSALFSKELKTDKSEAAARVDGGPHLVDILLVEDEVNDGEMTLRAFKKAGFVNRIEWVRDGEDALNYLFCRGKHQDRRTSENPHVLLLDLKLPKINGLEVLQRVRADKRTATMPVVILTVSDDQYDIQECRRLGADNYIVKPVNFQRLCLTTPGLDLEWGLLKKSEART